MNNQGLLIAFEGGEGAGKSTLIPYLKKALEQTLSVVTFREPGGTAFAEEIRNAFFNYNDLSIRTSVHLMNAQRQHNMERIVEPALQDNKIVIVDRFIASTLVYQGILHDEYNMVNALTKQHPMITVFVDVPPEIGLKRIADNNRETNHFDKMSIEKHNRIYKGYRSLAERKPEQYWDVVIDGTQSLAELENDMLRLAHLIISLSTRGLTLPKIKSKFRNEFNGMQYRPLKDHYLHYNAKQYDHLPIDTLRLPKDIRNKLAQHNITHYKDLMNTLPDELEGIKELTDDERGHIDELLKKRFSALSVKEDIATTSSTRVSNKSLIDHSVEHLDLHNRAINRLAFGRIYTIKDLLMTPSSEFPKIRQLGKKTGQHIATQLLQWAELNNVPLNDYPLFNYIQKVTKKHKSPTKV